jgi:apolipoprotein N-acyltransferase
MLRYVQMSRAHRDVDLIVWPETAITFFYHEARPYLSAIEAEHLFFGADFLVGIPILEQCTGQYFNAVVSLGSYSGYHPMFYRKNHLVPFGEYIPFYGIFGNLMQWLDVPLSGFSSGEVQQSPLMGAGQPIGVSICYEDAYSERVRSSLPQATLLVNVSNDAWFGDSIAPAQHLEIARMRALESERYLLRATNTGISAVIDDRGRITAQAPSFEIYALRTTAQPRQGATPYVRFGDTLILLVLLLSLGFVWIGAVDLALFPRLRKSTTT